MYTYLCSTVLVDIQLYRYDIVRCLNNRKIVTDSKKVLFGVLEIPYLCWWMWVSASQSWKFRISAKVPECAPTAH